MALREGYMRVQFSIERKLWKKLQGYRKQYHLPRFTYSDAVNSSLSTMAMMMEGLKTMKGKGDAEQRVEFYKIMSRVMSDLTDSQLKM